MMRWTLFAMLLGATAARAGDVQVAVDNVTGSTGVVRAEVCTAKEWLGSGCALKGVVAAQPGTTVVTVHNVPPGDWAVLAYHDKTNVGHVRQSWLGVPEDGVGFSRNPSLGLKGPSFADSDLQIGSAGARVPVHLHFE